MTSTTCTTKPAKPKPDSYEATVVSFDHRSVGGSEVYARFRDALNELALEHGGAFDMAGWLDLVRNSALSSPYSDCCASATCKPDFVPAWPCRVERNGDWLRCTYRCVRCHSMWTCGWSVDAPDGR